MLCTYDYRDDRFGTQKGFQADTEDVKEFIRKYDKPGCLMWVRVLLADGRCYHYASRKWTYVPNFGR